ncbi:MAG: glutamate-1-semialdehyde 2,1-aminomutase [Sphingobacteriales bacterium]|nr:MAG: glutamate-1-semialdehyde 2,1-aminomutase [Sphingobacteriales bacterium]
MILTKSKALYEEALQYFPGGVNSPVRAFKSVGGTPVFMNRGEGCHVWDADGNEYIDFCCSWGPLILGHNHPKVREKIIEAAGKGTSFGTPVAYELELARIILQHHRFIEKLRFVSSGTEAVMSALRLARGYTGRSKIIKFEGCYHGHVDQLLVKAGSGLVTFGESSSAGVPESIAKETIVVPLNDRESLKQAFELYSNQIAAVIIEPIPANNGLLIQDDSFLNYLRQICTQNNTLLIFDEVISGFRVGFEGAAGHYQIQPDLITFGKIIGGGMPVGAYGASKDIMKFVSPDGPVYQAGTLSGNPIAMAAGAAQLTECLLPGFYENLAQNTQNFVAAINRHCLQKAYEVKFFSIASIFWIAFTRNSSVHSAAEIDASKMPLFSQLFHLLLAHGIYLGPSGYEVGFISAAHTQADLKTAQEIFCRCLDIVFEQT